MKRIILCVSLFAFFDSQAQQINPVPDYVFSNKMSVGRNAVTDTAAYFSIGPRYGAIRGMMPPMVTDTASMSATKRNGLLIFSIQKNKYLYWDSVGSKWAEMAGTAGSAITGSGVAGYMPEFTTATNLDTTRLYHSNGRFAIGSTTTTNGVFNVYSGQSYMDSSLKIGNGELIVGSTSSASRKLYVTSNSDVARFEQTASDKNMVIELLHTNPNASGTIREEGINFLSPNTSTRGRITFYPSDTFNVRNYFAFFTPSGSGSTAERMRITNDGNIGIGTTSPSSLLEVNATSPRIRVVGTTGGAVNQYVTDGGQMFVGIDNSSASLFGNGAYSRVIYGGASYPLDFYTNDLIRARIKSDGEVLIGTTTDAGAYALQVAGSIYTTSNAIISGSLGINNTSPEARLHVIGAQRPLIIATDNATTLFTEYRYNTSTLLGYIGNGTGLVSGGSSSDFAMRAESQLLFMSGGNAERVRIKTDGEVLIGTTSDAGTYNLQVSGAIYNTSTLTTGAPTSGSAKPWRLGEAATVSPTSPNRTIRVEIDGTVYYIHAKTTND